MATFLEENRNGEMRKKEAKNGRNSGASASRQAWKAQKDKTRIACGLRSSLGFFAESIFSAEDMKTTYASTRLRLYPYKDVRSRLSQQVTAEWRWCCGSPAATPLSLQRSEESAIRSRAARFSLHVVHHRESAVSAGANYQALALPRNFLSNRERRMHHGISWTPSSSACGCLHDQSPHRAQVTPSIRIEPKAKSSKRIEPSIGQTPSELCQPISQNGILPDNACCPRWKRTTVSSYRS
jgi:hypothetical protein